MPEPINFDLVADLYDSYVITDLDIRFFLEETVDYNEEILELMCGTGRISIQLLKAGRKLCCVDYSEKMLKVFEEKIKSEKYPVRIIAMDVTNLNLNNKFGIAILPFHSLSEILTSELQAKAVKAIAKHLKNGGIFICSLQNPAVRLQSADGELRRIGEFRLDEFRKMTVSYVNKFDHKSGLVSGYQQYEIFDNSDMLIETRKLKINFKPVSDCEFQCFIKNTDLEIISRYGDYNKNPFEETTSNFLIYKLKKNK